MIKSPRIDPHFSALKIARIIFGDPQRRCDCLVREFKEFGAIIEVEPHAMLPDAFRLIAPALNLDHHCEVVRREDRTIGVRFVG